MKFIRGKEEQHIGYVFGHTWLCLQIIVFHHLAKDIHIHVVRAHTCYHGSYNGAGTNSIAAYVGTGKAQGCVTGQTDQDSLGAVFLCYKMAIAILVRMIRAHRSSRAKNIGTTYLGHSVPFLSHFVTVTK